MEKTDSLIMIVLVIIALSKDMEDEDLGLLAALLTWLGDTLAVMAVIRSLDSSQEAVTAELLRT